MKIWLTVLLALLLVPGLVSANTVLVRNTDLAGDGITGGAGPGVVDTLTIASPDAWFAAIFLDGGAGSAGVFDIGEDTLVGGGLLVDGSLNTLTPGLGYYSINSTDDPISGNSLFAVVFAVLESTLATTDFGSAATFSGFWADLPTTYWYSETVGDTPTAPSPYSVGTAAVGQEYLGGEDGTWVLVPEPGTMSLFALGLLTLAARRKLRK